MRYRRVSISIGLAALLLWHSGCRGEAVPDPCGNGASDPGEACDDGNREAGDGCGPACTVEPGWTCEGHPSVCEPICGDGLAVGSEVCDGLDLRGRDCITLGFWEGTLACQSDCMGLDTSGCSPCVRGVCTVSAGMEHTCAVMADGTAWCWGSNEHGQLGDGTTTQSPTPVQVRGITDARWIAAGRDHTCVVRTDGTVWCWGSNEHGQLGDGTTTERHTPVQVQGLTDVRLVSAGDGYSCAVLGDGTAWCWGDNGNGQLGSGTFAVWERHTPVRVQGLTEVRWLSVGDHHACAVLEDGTVWCWGENAPCNLGINTAIPSATPLLVEPLHDARRAWAGTFHSCAALGDGTAWCWGQDSSGQLGDGTTADCKSPVQVQGLSEVKWVSAGGMHTCAVRDDGTAWCWGSNFLHQLGDGTFTDSKSPTPIQVQGLTDVHWLSAGVAHTCAVRDDGTAWCWGSNTKGQLGDGTTVSRPTPVLVHLP